MAVKKPLGELLVEKGLITEDQIRIALLEQKKANIPLGKLLVNLGFVTEATIRDALSENLGQVSVDLSTTVVAAELVKMIPLELARRHKAIPIAFDEATRTLTVALSDTFNIVAIDQIRASLGGDIHLAPVLAGEADIARAIEPVLRPRAVHRRHPARDRNRRDRLPEPPGRERRIQPAGGAPGRRPAHRRGASAAPPTCTSSRKPASCASATASTACCARSAACTRTTGRRSRCAQGDFRHEHRRNTRPAGRPHFPHPHRPPASISASPPSPPPTARTWCCASSTGRRASSRWSGWA